MTDPIAEEIEHLLWDMKTWRSMPDATHNYQIVEAYKIGMAQARKDALDEAAKLVESFDWYNGDVNDMADDIRAIK